MVPTGRLDPFEPHRAEYTAPTHPVLVEVPPARYLAIEGRGGPGGQEFHERLAALLGMAYTVKMARRLAGQPGYAIGQLEALWWSDAGDLRLAGVPPADLRWRLLIRTPEFVSDEERQTAAMALRMKGTSPLVREVALVTLAEGLCVQVLHVGPHAEQDQTLDRMDAFAAQRGLTWHGLHHEVFLSEPQAAPHERLQMLVRRPVR